MHGFDLIRSRTCDLSLGVGVSFLHRVLESSKIGAVLTGVTKHTRNGRVHLSTRHVGNQEQYSHH
jgi:hypothetical protein